MAPPKLNAPGEKPAPPPMEEPVFEQQPDTDAIQPNPAAVGYRTEAETCGNCTYHAGGFCQHPVVAMETPDGASCMAFESGGGMEPEMGGMEMEE